MFCFYLLSSHKIPRDSTRSGHLRYNIHGNYVGELSKLLSNASKKPTATRRGRIFRETLTAYLFILPASAIIFTFGIFPVGFAFFVSLHNWRRFPDEYIGIDNYTRALGNLGFVLFFWLGLGLVVYAALMLYRVWQRASGKRSDLAYLMPGVAVAAAIALFVNWFFKLLPAVLEIPQRLPRGELRDRGKFIGEFFKSFTLPEVLDAALPMAVAVVVALALTMAMMRLVKAQKPVTILFRATMAAFAAIGGVWLLQLTIQEIDLAIETARAEGEELAVWSQTILISAGVALLAAAFGVWQKAVRDTSDRRFVIFSLLAIQLALGGYLLVSQLPAVLTAADDDLMQGFWVTALYVAGTVPVQLSLALGLAALLFRTAKGKAIFRIVYFLPYITPFAATAVVFSVLFSNRDESPINRLLGIFGIEPQTWLLEPKPVNELIFGVDLPRIIEGPGLALLVIIIWSTWTYVGFDIVVFLAGLGNISPEFYEAAQIDGASPWKAFRHITLPLLSPTTFFLSLIAIIGTFQAFTQIWIMRRPASYDAVDTVGVYLYEVIADANPRYGFGSAMAFVLFGLILIVTLLQNRVMGRKVFYG